MSAHTLLVAHNLAVLDAFFAGVRKVLGSGGDAAAFTAEVDHFVHVYGTDDQIDVLEEAQRMWRDVELARGKGRLRREAAKQVESTVGTAVELE
jgi:hypothetical protein